MVAEKVDGLEGLGPRRNMKIFRPNSLEHILYASCLVVVCAVYAKSKRPTKPIADGHDCAALVFINSAHERAPFCRDKCSVDKCIFSC